MLRRAALCSMSLVAAWTVACHRSTPPETIGASLPLCEGALSAHWQPAAIENAGAAGFKDGVLSLHAGQPMTGMRFGSWASAGLPLSNYAITFEARRVAGGDFFAAATFPVGAVDRCVTFVAGGWGGGVTGISSIDDADAAGNESRSEQVYAPGQWYRFRIEVRDDDLRAWIDDRIVVNVGIKGRRLSLRAGDIMQCAPFGFASYATDGEVRRVVVATLSR